MKSPCALILAAALAMILAACGNQSSAPSGASTMPSSQADASADQHINSPIPPDAISTRLEFEGHPTYDKDDDSLNVEIRVSNQGKRSLVSAGTAMVRLGAMLVGPNGPDQPPGNRDFKRIDLPMTPAGQSSVVDAQLPARLLLGLHVRFDLVQEGVNWFSAYGQPTLDLGPYTRCNNQEKSLCDGNGHPVPAT
jgi:hypothetical protein